MVDCAICGMACEPGEFHPYAACLMYRACGQAATVRANLKASHYLLGLPEKGEVFVEAYYHLHDGKVTFERTSIDRAPDWVQRAHERFYGSSKGLDADPPPAEAQAVYAGADLEGGWIRATAPPSAPVGVERKYPDDGNGDDDAYNRGWNDCLDALAQQPAAVDGAVLHEYIEARDAYEAATRPPNSHAPAPRLKHGDPIVLRYQKARAALAGKQGGVK